MSDITETPPRGGLRETIGGAPRVLLLHLAEIERFEDAHRGILALRASMNLLDRAPPMREIADLLILALIGGGMAEAEARDAVKGELPQAAERQFLIARALVAVTLNPDLVDQLELEDDDPPGKPMPAASMSAG